MEHAELAAWLRLLLTDGVGSATARRLLAAFGLPQAIFLQSHAALRQVVSNRQADALLRAPENLSALLDTTQRWLHSAPDGLQRRILTLGDALYPPTLLNIEDPPPLLYAEGRIDVLENCGWPQRAIAIVGSRNPTPQGFGYAVFGKVTKGMEVVDKIAKVQTGNRGMHQDVPVKPVVIKKVTVEEAAKPEESKKPEEGKKA